MPKLLLYSMDADNYSLMPDDAIGNGTLEYTATNCEDAMLALMNLASYNHDFELDRLETHNEVLIDEYLAAMECSMRDGRHDPDNDHEQVRHFCEVGRKIMEEDNGKVALFGVWI